MDYQLKKCKTVKDLVNTCYSVVNFSSKVCVDGSVNESSKKKKTEKQGRGSNTREKLQGKTIKKVLKFLLQ